MSIKKTFIWDFIQGAFFILFCLKMWSAACETNISWYQMTNNKVFPDSKVHGANMGPIWVLSAPDGPHVGPMNLAIRVHSTTAKVVSNLKQQWSWWDGCLVLLVLKFQPKEKDFILPPWGSRIFHVNYRKVSNIRRTKSQNLNASHLIL